MENIAFLPIGPEIVALAGAVVVPDAQLGRVHADLLVVGDREPPPAGRGDLQPFGVAIEELGETERLVGMFARDRLCWIDHPERGDRQRRGERRRRARVDEPAVGLPELETEFASEARRRLPAHPRTESVQLVERLVDEDEVVSRVLDVDVEGS